MAAITYPTFFDVLKARNPKGGLLRMIEQKRQINAILEDAPYIEGNETNGHKFSLQKGLPAISWVRHNQFVAPGKGSEEVVTETPGMAISWFTIARTLAEGLNGADYRERQEMNHNIAMTNEVATQLFYASSKTDPTKFHGLSPRFDSGNNAETGQNVGRTAGASGNNCSSIWLIGWGEDTCHLFYKAGAMAGIRRMDHGLQVETDANGGQLAKFKTEFQWDIGLAIPDWRYVVRMQVDLDEARTGGNINDLVIWGLNRIQDLSNCVPVMYCNRAIHTLIEQQTNNKSNAFWTPGEFGGRKVLTARGVPLRLCEAITSTESAVTSTNYT